MDKRKVYIYQLAGQSSFGGLACGCHMHQRSGEGWTELWFLEPPDHGHMIQGKVTGETESGFTFRSEGYAPGDWAFKVLTIQDFRRKYFKLVVGGDAITSTIKTTEDLHEWYRKEFKF